LRGLTGTEIYEQLMQA